MKKQEFINKLKEELEVEIEVTIDTSIKDLDEWDSLGAMILIAFVSDSFGVTLSADDIKNISTFKSLIELIGLEKFE